MCVCICMCIYIYRERERYTHVYIYIYIYILDRPMSGALADAAHGVALAPLAPVAELGHALPGTGDLRLNKCMNVIIRIHSV